MPLPASVGKAFPQLQGVIRYRSPAEGERPVDGAVRSAPSVEKPLPEMTDNGGVSITG